MTDHEDGTIDVADHGFALTLRLAKGSFVNLKPI
jgi:hypothetical protein